MNDEFLEVDMGLFILLGNVLDAFDHTLHTIHLLSLKYFMNLLNEYQVHSPVSTCTS